MRAQDEIVVGDPASDIIRGGEKHDCAPAGSKCRLKFSNYGSQDLSTHFMEEAYAALVASPDVQVEISGHTDYVGSELSNQKLSLRRAQTVKNWLVHRGTATNRLKTNNKGESEPVGDNGTDAGRAENRRIEFYVQQ